jgi:hypothetical protein
MVGRLFRASSKLRIALETLKQQVERVQCLAFGPFGDRTRSRLQVPGI